MCYKLAKSPVQSHARLFLPTALIDVVFKYRHESPLGMHMGHQKTHDRVNAVFYHPGLERIIRERVARCLTCHRSKHSNTTYGTLSSTPTLRPMAKLYIDVCGALPHTQSQHTNILVALDGFSRYCFLVPLEKQTTEAVVTALRNSVRSTFGYPT